GEDVGSGKHAFYHDVNKTPILQYFEKGRFELHLERRTNPGYETLAGLDRYSYLIDQGNVGLELAGARGYKFDTATRQGPDSATYKWFFQTNHSLQPPFLNYWNSRLGNLMFGSPISEPFEETNPETGKRWQVQYFEKARLEFHPASGDMP